MRFDRLRFQARLAMARVCERARQTLAGHGAPSVAGRRLEIDGLEDRVLLSASPLMSVVPEMAIVADVSPVSVESLAVESPMVESAAVESADASKIGERAAEVSEVFVIDSNTPDAERLLDDLQAQKDAGRKIEVFWLDSQRDGIEQISDMLAKYSGLEAVHIVSHGAAGEVQLGNSRLTLDSLSGYAGELAQWGHSLSSDADILFYGCDLAATESGRWLVDSISVLTGADVAASSDLTGNRRLGGDWLLEFASGPVAAADAFSEQTQAEWEGLLNAVSFQNGTSGYSGTADSYVDQSNAGTSFSAAGTVTVANPGASNQTQGLLRFDNIFGNAAGQVPYGSTINSARVEVNVTDPQSAAAPVTLHQMLIGFGSAPTWTSLVSGVQLDDVEAVATANSTLSNSNAVGVQSFLGLEATVQSWSNGGPNNGWAVNTTGSDSWGFDSSEAATASVRPRLVIDYSPPQLLMIDTTNDVLDGDVSSVSALVLNRGADGKLSLREALLAANSTAGAQTIQLPSGTYSLSLTGANEDVGNTGDLDVQGDVSIIGTAAATTIIDGGGADRVFDVRGSSVAAFENLTIRSGSTSADGGE